MVFLPAADGCMTLTEREQQTELVSQVVLPDLLAFVTLKGTAAKSSAIVH